MKHLIHPLAYALLMALLASTACSEAEFDEESAHELDYGSDTDEPPGEEAGGETGAPDPIDEFEPGPGSEPPESRILSFEEVDGVYAVVAEPGSVLRERFADVARIEIQFDANHVELAALDHDGYLLVDAGAQQIEEQGAVHDLHIELDSESRFDMSITVDRLSAEGHLAGIPYGIDAAFVGEGELAEIEKTHETSLPPTLQARLADMEALTADAMPLFEEIGDTPLEDSIECKAAKLAAATAALIATVACCAATEGIGCPLCTVGATLFVAAVEVC